MAKILMLENQNPTGLWPDVNLSGVLCPTTGFEGRRTAVHQGHSRLVRFFRELFQSQRLDGIVEVELDGVIGSQFAVLASISTVRVICGSALVGWLEGDGGEETHKKRNRRFRTSNSASARLVLAQST